MYEGIQADFPEEGNACQMSQFWSSKMCLKLRSTPYCAHFGPKCWIIEAGTSEQPTVRIGRRLRRHRGPYLEVRNWESGRAISMVGLGMGVVELNSIGGGDEAESKVATEGNSE